MYGRINHTKYPRSRPAGSAAGPAEFAVEAKPRISDPVILQRLAKSLQAVQVTMPTLIRHARPESELSDDEIDAAAAEQHEAWLEMQQELDDQAG